MPRDGSGNYTLPAGNPVVTGTLIESAWANPTMADFAVQFNNVITRDGLLGPTNPFKLVDGSKAAPGLSFNSEPGTGFYRVGSFSVGFASGNAQVMQWDVSTASQANYEFAPRQTAAGASYTSIYLHGAPIPNTTSNILELGVQDTIGGYLISTDNNGVDKAPMIYDGSQHTFYGPVAFANSTTAAPTGMFGLFMLPVAPAGWIAGDGSTIGNVGSGATRANIDTLALFTAWWAYTDPILPIYTSTGVLSSRGVSAASDWAALKRLSVFDVRDRMPRAAGPSFTNGAYYPSTTQAHQHRLPLGWDSGIMYLWNDVSGFPAFSSTVETGASKSEVNKTGIVGGATIRVGKTDSVLTNLSGESAPNGIAMLGCFKL